MSEATTPVAAAALHPVDQIKNADLSQSKLELDKREQADWLEYACNGVRPLLTLDMIRAVLDSSDPALEAVKTKLREACEITPDKRDVYILATRLAKEGEVEFDADAPISMGDDNGAYVGSFTWVDFSGTPLDIEVEPDEPEPTQRNRA